jgi:hypothetical protein
MTFYVSNMTLLMAQNLLSVNSTFNILKIFAYVVQ